MDLISEVGAIAGLAAFLGLAVLALLYFAQARDLRRLRENASFLVEGREGAPAPARPRPAKTAAAAAPAATAPTATAQAAPDEPTTGEEPEEPRTEADAEAFRRAELARQAEERRRRFEERRRQENGAYGGLGGVPGGWVAIVGALILLAGVGFGATRILGGEDSAPAGNTAASQKPGQVSVAVFNGTAEPGLAADFAQTMQQVTGYTPDPITNTDSPFETSTVMFESGAREIADEVAKALGITEITGMDPEIRRASDQAPVAVILGDDKATGA